MSNSTRQRFYLNGKLTSSTPGSMLKLRKQLDTLEAHWLKYGLFPLASEGFDPNKAHSVERVSVDELIVVTTGNKTLRFVNV